jgi:hypothetical protein
MSGATPLSLDGARELLRRNALELPEYAAQVEEMYADMRLLYNKDEEVMAAMEEIIAYRLFTRGNWLKKLFNLVGGT